ncbi:MAG: chemotaxis protein CheA [Desulfobacterales bacterium]|nr:chemotaxis protein CheA [Desulfobacterales bacterium]
MNKYLIDKYKKESYKLLTELEALLLDLDETPGDTELTGRIFGTVHTIKGTSAMFGFDDIAAFTHKLETIFEMVRDGKIPVSSELIDPALSACDLIRKMVDKEETDEAEISKIIKILSQFQNTEPEIREEKKNKIPLLSPDSSSPATYRIRFRPGSDIISRGYNPMHLLDDLRELGECKVVGQTTAVPTLKDIDPEACYLYWDVILTTSEDASAVGDVFMFVEEEGEINIDVLDKKDIPADTPDYKKLGEVLVDRGDLSSDDLDRVLREQKRIGELLVKAEVVDEGAVESGLAEQEHVREIRKKRWESRSSSNIMISVDKLDRFLDMVGELVTFQAYLSRKASRQKDTELQFIAEGIERLTEELRYTTMEIRMLPVSTIFSIFRRLIRDLSRELGKDVAITTEGEDTELDKSIIERLNDPFMHIIRNCIDHGIETPENRETAGKPRQGMICMSAEYSGAYVLIRVSDDGAGLDCKAICARAAEKGLITPGTKIPESKIYELVFAPEVSTAKELTKVSGRGAGMGVVKRSIEALRGSVGIESRKGVGTTITLKLPLTLAIIDGLLVKVGDGNYVLPLSVVEECVELLQEDAATARKRNVMCFREKIIPYLSLRDIFMAGKEYPEVEQVVISEANSTLIGFGVDRVIGEHQTVIKPLNKFCNNIKGISGASILGDGTVALILDVNQLVKSVKEVAADINL